jgi:predicted XRE-type DNA-binding protein
MRNKMDKSMYRMWINIKARLFNKNNPRYYNYGGRGINMDPRWIHDFIRFNEDIIESIGLKPSPDHSIDRIDNNLGYFIWNLKWSTSEEQSSNRSKRKLSETDVNEIRKLIYDKMFSQAELAKLYGVTQGHISHIIKNIRWKEDK